MLGKPVQDRYLGSSEAWGWAISHATTHSPDPSADASANPSEPRESVYDLDRLERAITALAEDNARLREEGRELRRSLDEKAARVVRLEGELLDANQKRQDVAKRIDELLSQMDALDAQLAQAEAGPEAR